MGPAAAGNSGISDAHLNLLQYFVMSTNCVKNKIHSENWITQTEAARLRKVTPSAIARLIDRGRIRSKVIARRRLVHREDVSNFKTLAAQETPTKIMKEAARAVVDREKWITFREAANLRGITISGIRTAIQRGRIRFLKKRGVPFVNRQDVLNYKPRIDFCPEIGLQSALPPGEKPEDWITVEKAAQIRGITKAAIFMQVSRKRIRSIKLGDTRLVHRQDILGFKRKPQTPRSKKRK